MDNGSRSYDRYLNGDDSALSEIVHEYKDGLTLYLNTFTNNLYDAEEIMEETFYKLAYKKPKFKGKSSFRTWLYSIGRNLAIDYLRKRSRHSAESLEDHYDLKGNEDIELNYIKEEQKKMIHKAIHDLRSEYRQVICLIYLEGFDTSEAARIMHKTNRQITNLLYQAKKVLKKELEKGGVSYEGL